MDYYPRLSSKIFHLLCTNPVDRYLQPADQERLAHVLYQLKNCIFGLAELYVLRHKIGKHAAALAAAPLDPALERLRRFGEAMEKAALTFVNAEGGKAPLSVEDPFWQRWSAHLGRAFHEALMPLLPPLPPQRDLLEGFEKIIAEAVRARRPEIEPVLLEICRTLERLHSLVERIAEGREVTLRDDGVPPTEWPAHVISKFFIAGGLELVLHYLAPE